MMVDSSLTTINDIFQAFFEYRDQYGLNQLYKTGSTQNGALFTMEYLLCLAANYTPGAPTVSEEINRVGRVYDTLEIAPGLTVRLPGSLEGDSMDNLAALLTYSALYGNRSFAKRMLAHGADTRATGIDLVQDPDRNKRYYPLAYILNGFKPPRYFWNNTQPTKFCIWGWFGRSPGFIALLRYAAGEKMGILGGLSLYIGQFIGCFKDRSDADARKLPYVTWKLLRHKSRFWALSYKLWCYILHMQYTGGMRDVYALYYQDPNHPIRRYSPPYLP